MTPQEKAKELVYKFSELIMETDFHIPEFISGINCADGSQEYGKLLEEETELLARLSALICVDELVRCLPSVNGRPPNYQDVDKYTSEYWEEVKKELNLSE